MSWLLDLVYLFALFTLSPWLLYRAWGIRAETRSIRAGCFVGGTGLAIGLRSFVNYGCFFDTTAPVELGADCYVGMQATFCTSSHELAGPTRRAGALSGRPIRIGDGCWIGARALILPGVQVGPGCVVAAGAVVTGDCAPHGLYAGNPARRVRDLPTGSQTP